ncbi:MAG: tetratricopeptide repeat protein [Myxococcota bacterium]
MDPTVLAALTIAAFEDADLDLARTSAQRAVRVEDRLAPAWYYLGLVHERTGNPKQAAHAFQRAHAIDPDTHPLPLVLTDAQWLEASEHAQANLPPAIQAFYVQVPLVWEPYPDRADLQTAAPALNPLIGALFVGVPPLDGDPWKTLPQAVRVFTGNLKHALPSGSTLIDRLSHALLQEALSWTGAGIDDLLTAFPTRR